MKIQYIAKLLADNYKHELLRKKTLFLLGPSGVGKSDSFRQAIKDLEEHYGEKFGLIDLRLAQMDPVEFGGVPSVVNGRTHKNPPSWLPTEGRGFILLDEITSAPQTMQAPAYQFTLDRRFGDTDVPDGWMVVAAGNRMTDRGVTYPMAAPLLARMTVINVQSDLDGFMDYAATTGVRGEIIAFIKSRPDYLNQRDETINAKIGELPLGKPFATQRAWTTAAQYYLDFPAETRLELLRGCVGDAAASDFEAFLRVWETMPDIDMVFKDPQAVEVPKDAATRYAVAVGVSMRTNKKTFDKAYAYLKRMPKEHMALAMKLAYKRCKGTDDDITNAKGFIQFVTENQNLWKTGA